MNAPRGAEHTAPDAQHLMVDSLQVCGAQGPLDARLYGVMTDGPRDTLIVFFHGGGFVHGDLDHPDSFLRQLVTKNTHALVLSSSYTLAPIAPFPAAAEDAYAVLLWAKKHRRKLGWTGEHLLVAGVEAGANLAAVAALMSRDRTRPQLAGQILLAPMLDAGLSSASMRTPPSNTYQAKLINESAAAYRSYLPRAADRAHPYASPLQSSRLKHLPSALIVSTEDDPLRDEADAYGAKLLAATVDATVHRVDAMQLRNPDARNACACGDQVLDVIARFIASAG